MRSFLLGGVLLGLASVAQAQELPKTLDLKLTIEQTMLVTQVLGQVGCTNVTQLAICNRAVELLRSIQEQVKAQGGG